MKKNTTHALKAVLTLLWLLITTINPAHAANDLLTQIATRLAEPAVIRAEFTQEKRLAALTRPILSRGRLTVSRQDGVLWQLEAPLRMTLIFSESRMIEISPEGKRVVRDARDSRTQAEIGRVIRGLLAADLDSLRRYFDLRASGTPEQWRIELTPRAAEVAQFIKTLRLAGANRLDSIRVEEANGDSTDIRMRNTETATGLSATERALFAP